MRNNPVIILGGGITGLSAAWYLEKKGVTDILLIESSHRTGGKVETLHEAGFLIEKGPDAFVTSKPYGLNLVREMGMEPELISPKTNRFYILGNGKLANPPKGLKMMAPLDLEGFLASRFFSWPAKHRILEEATVAPGNLQGDESFADFITRRFGSEMLDLYAGPLFTGIYATPAGELSLNATFPALKAMEQQYGSISRAMKKKTQVDGNSNRSGFAGLKNGMQSLTDALAARLKHTKILLNTKVVEITAQEGSYMVTATNGQKFETSKLIITLPATQVSTLMKPISAEISTILSGFPVSSSRIVTLAYKEGRLSENLLATGYVSALHEKNPVASATWSSSKWEGRAPQGYALIRCFMSKTADILQMTADQLISTAHKEMQNLLHFENDPEYYWVQDWEQALPQYKVGHPDKVKALKAAIAPYSGLHITGSYLHGVGLPDCIKQGIDAAESL